MTTRRLSVAALTLPAALFLAACGSTAPPVQQHAAASSSAVASPTPAPAPAASASPSTFPSQQLPRAEVERLFVAHLEESGVIPRYGDAASSLELADLICVHFNQGGTMPGLLATLAQGGTMPESEVRSFAAAAAVAFCPQNVKAVVTG